MNTPDNTNKDTLHLGKTSIVVAADGSFRTPKLVFESPSEDGPEFYQVYSNEDSNWHNVTRAQWDEAHPTSRRLTARQLTVQIVTVSVDDLVKFGASLIGRGSTTDYLDEGHEAEAWVHDQWTDWTSKKDAQ